MGFIVKDAMNVSDTLLRIAMTTTASTARTAESLRDVSASFFYLPKALETILT